MLLSLLLVAWTALPPGAAAAFGTIGTGGQNREHERITRAALACAGDGGAEPNCFEPRTIDYLAGHDREFGAVGAPDNDELSNPAAHCDNADFLAGGYPRVRDEATAALVDCVSHMRARFGGSVDSAQGLLDDQGDVIAEEVNPDPECNPREDVENRAKCAALEGLGRVLHGAQDFYAHSNWADEADPTRPVGDANPPGLNLPGPSPVLDLRAGSPPAYATGPHHRLLRGEGRGSRRRCLCLARDARGAQQGPGSHRPRHGARNRPDDTAGNGRGQLRQGGVGSRCRDPSPMAGPAGGKAALSDRYGTVRGERIICALTHDDPVNDCRGVGWSRVLGVLLIASVVVAAAAIILVVRRRGRRRAA